MNAVRVMLALLVVAACGCATVFEDPYRPQRALEEAQLRYTQLMRWGELEMASQYVDPQHIEKFRAYGPAFEQIRITDYEIGRIMVGEDGESASVIVVYQAYGINTLVEKTIREHQEWARDEPSGRWHVQPALDGLLDGFSAR